MLSSVDMDAKRVAIVFQRENQTIVLAGVGASIFHPTLGPVLRVELDEEQRTSENATLFILEADVGRLAQYCSVQGCEFCIKLD